MDVRTLGGSGLATPRLVLGAPEVLLTEVDTLESKGISCARLRVSGNRWEGANSDVAGFLQPLGGVRAQGGVGGHDLSGDGPAVLYIKCY